LIVAAVAVVAVIALTAVSLLSWRVSQAAVAGVAVQPRPDPTPAPEVSDPRSSATAAPESPTPANPSGPTATSAPLPTDPARWPIVPRIDPAMRERLGAIFAQGQALGNHPDVFVKVGDSITVSEAFLTDVGCGAVDLADHRAVQQAIDFFSQRTFPASYASAWCGVANAFTRTSLSAGVGWTADVPMQPFSGPPPDPRCAEPPYDAPLPCELSLLRPSVALIMFGTNDVERSSDPATFAQELQALVGVSVAAGAIPILSTIPPRPSDAAMDERVKTYNEAIVRVAAAARVPLVNYWRALIDGDTVNEGISEDGVHPNVYGGCSPHCGSADFGPEGLRYGYNVRNLTALQALEKVLRTMIYSGSSGAPAQG
jgi:hypothetical protein